MPITPTTETSVDAGVVSPGWRSIARAIPDSILLAEAQRRGLAPGSQGFVQRKNSNGWDESYMPTGASE